MSLLKPVCQFAAPACGVVLLAVAAWADDSSANAGTSQSAVFEVSLYKGEVVGSAQIQRVIVTSGTNQFLIVVPRGLRMEVSTPGKIVLAPPDHGYFLTFRIIGIPVAGSSTSQTDTYRGLLSNQYPGAKFMEEFCLTAAGRIGPAFDLLWLPSGASKQSVRVAFIPSAAGVLEFSMIADAQNAAEGQYAFNGFLGGFRSNEKGKLEIILISDNS